MDVDGLLALDRALFAFLNGSFHAGWLDQVMLVFTDVGAARPLLAIAALALVTLGRRSGLAILLGAVITLTLSDQLAAHVIKPWVGRERPCSALPDVVLLVKCTGSFSFPSAHAANTFAGAFYFSRFARFLTIPLYLLAALVSFSRIYVGVHYPLDLAGGALLGTGCALLVLAVLTRIGWGPRRRPERAGRRARRRRTAQAEETTSSSARAAAV